MQINLQADGIRDRISVLDDDGAEVRRYRGCEHKMVDFAEIVKKEIANLQNQNNKTQEMAEAAVNSMDVLSAFIVKTSKMIDFELQTQYAEDFDEMQSKLKKINADLLRGAQP